MTMKIPRMSIVDKLLARIGRRRAVYIPGDIDHERRYAYAWARKEPVVCTLLRPKNKALPRGWHYLDSLPRPKE